MAAAGTCGTGTRSTGSMVAAASTNNVTSFQRRGPRASGADSGCSRLVSIAGTRPSVRNGQLLVSTGLPALDQLLGRFRTEIWAQQREKREGTCRVRHPDPTCLSPLSIRTWREWPSLMEGRKGCMETLNAVNQIWFCAPTFYFGAHQPFSRL